MLASQYFGLKLLKWKKNSVEVKRQLFGGWPAPLTGLVCVGMIPNNRMTLGHNYVHLAKGISNGSVHDSPSVCKQSSYLNDLLTETVRPGTNASDAHSVTIKTIEQIWSKLHPFP